MVEIRKSYKAGISFGLVSGVLTTLGLLIGLGVSTQSKAAVIGGILTIAIADALSDSFGVHLSQESSGTNSKRNVWEATFSTFFSKFFIAISFLIPVIMFNLKTSVIVSVLWGLLLIGSLSLLVSKSNGDRRKEILGVISEHLVLFLIVVSSSYLAGYLIESLRLS
jgi:hypothetical protein